MSVYRRFVNNGQNLAAQNSFNMVMTHGQFSWHNRIVLGRENSEPLDESQNIMVKQKVRNKIIHTLISIYMKFRNKQNKFCGHRNKNG